MSPQFKIFFTHLCYLAAPSLHSSSEIIPKCKGIYSCLAAPHCFLQHIFTSSWCPLFLIYSTQTMSHLQFLWLQLPLCYSIYLLPVAGSCINYGHLYLLLIYKAITNSEASSMLVVGKKIPNHKTQTTTKPPPILSRR